MNIVLEGPDGGGKSTLATKLSEFLGVTIQQGSGPPKTPGEINERIINYLKIDGKIFDRHPAVSQCIYGKIRDTDNNQPDDDLVNQFYATKPILIYCRASKLVGHVVKEGEDPAHIEALTKNYRRLVILYDAWALNHANHIYRIGDDLDRVFRMVGGLA